MQHKQTAVYCQSADQQGYCAHTVQSGLKSVMKDDYESKQVWRKCQTLQVNNFPVFCISLGSNAKCYTYTYRTTYTVEKKNEKNIMLNTLNETCGESHFIFRNQAKPWMDPTTCRALPTQVSGWVIQTKRSTLFYTSNNVSVKEVWNKHTWTHTHKFSPWIVMSYL